MNIEEQKFMAIHGIHTWAKGALVQVERIDAARQTMLSNFDRHDERADAIQSFQRERHLFLIAAHKTIEYADWIVSLNFLDSSIFSEIFSFRNDVKDLRDMNEHVREYFLGIGHRPEQWVHSDSEGSADASSTVNSKIGGRLDWNDFANATKRLIASIPPHYYPQQT